MATNPYFWHVLTGACLWLIGGVYVWRYLHGDARYRPRQAMVRSLVWPFIALTVAGRALHRTTLRPLRTNRWEVPSDPLPAGGSGSPMPTVAPPPTSKAPVPPPTRFLVDSDPSSW